MSQKCPPMLFIAVASSELWEALLAGGELFSIERVKVEAKNSIFENEETIQIGVSISFLLDESFCEKECLDFS